MTEIQAVILSIFKEVATICDRHNIPYYAIGGTCIGAVRHKGFIPWDDDLDIAIPIELFDDFLSLARKELPEYLYVLTCNDVRHYHNVFSKICDKRTTFIENNNLKYPDSYKGVFVDIMPLSGVPASYIGKFIFKIKIRLFGAFNRYIRFTDAKPISFRRKIINIFFILFSHFVGITYFSDKYLNLLKSYPFKGSKFTGYVWHDIKERLIFPSSWFSSTINLKFEDIEIKCPVRYHDYLTKQFGDYMTPPTASNQITHKGIIDLKRSYIDYATHGL